MAVISRTEFFMGIRWTQGLVILVILCGVAQGDHQRCETARAELARRGFSVSSFPENSSRGPICGEDSCCSAEFERNLVPESRSHLDKFLRNSFTKLYSVLDTRAKRFDDFFREMMSKSKKEFHEMFKKTYGVIYLQNSYVFTDFFEELERYYNKGQVRLADTLDNFFGILYQRMFVVINSQYQFNDTYLNCVAEHMAEMKPFGDVPHTLGVQLKRSFVATRTFYVALQKGASVAQNMIQLKPDEECVRRVAEMRHCGFCKGLSGPVACLDFCVGTLQGCLQHYAALGSAWDNFVEAVSKVADRLLGPSNIEMVVEPINIKISEAIMNFQESGTEVSQRIFTGCGTPKLGRRRRDVKNESEEKKDEISLETLSFHDKKKKHKKTDSAPSLDKLIREIKTKVKESRQFWIHLPYQFCNMENVTASSNTNDCFKPPTNPSDASALPPKTPPPHTSPPLVQEQLYTVQIITSKLQSAYQGQDVDLVDDTEESLAGSGSGSGDGVEEDVQSGDGGFDVDFETPAVTQPPPPSSTKPPDKTRTVAGAGNVNTISLARALAHYLLPIVLVWFGGAISDLL